MPLPPHHLLFHENSERFTSGCRHRLTYDVLEIKRVMLLFTGRLISYV